VSWADAAIERLRLGEAAVVRPRGTMTPRVRSGAVCELEPVSDADVLRRGDIVLVKVKGTVYLHLITALEKERVQIGNNHGRINGWTPMGNVYGRVKHIDNTGGAH
jgi:hypothetical protein